MTLMTPPPIDQQQQQQPEDDEMLVPHTDFPQGPQPMEVAQSETANTVDAQPVDDPPSARFTWTIDSFSRINMKKLYSDVFYVGGYKWRILIFPKGNNVDHLSMYLDVADSSTLPYGWSRYAQFSLSIVNQIHSKYSVRKETQHQFNARESDWGFTSFMPLGELYDPARGYLVNDSCIVEADVAVRRVVDYWSHDSKKETGFVGLKNQGATCYMNSLLQTLYHIPYFRKAVYHMPTTENDNPSGSIPLALQSLFYKLQYSDTSVATKELTKSFGWDTYDSFMQHDVQELNRVLCEKLEDKMKGTVVEGTIQQLFEGHHMNYIECINVDYKSTRKESFYDLQLDVKGCRDVYASFDKYVEVERLEGDNKYHAEQYGLQDAKKGVLFIDFPPVLQLQLKRFEYDFVRDTMVKINDRYEFPLQLDLDREEGKYLSPDADRSIRNLYTLHSVLVHSGGVHGGHYYAYIRPTLSDQWFKFDDERVTKEDMKRALEEQYGGEEELPQTNPGFNNAPFKFTKYSNAYMLVYIRESDKEKIICNVDEKDIAEHLRVRLKKEQEEKELKRKEKAEAHLYTIIKVARNEDLLEQIGKDIYFDLVDHDKVRSFRIQKQMPFNLFKEEVAKEFGVPVQFQRFWLWAKRQNHTYRPNRPLTPLEETQSVGQLREVSNKANNAELKLFLEIEVGPDLRSIAPPEKTKEEILLFFKLYDPVKEEMRFIGRLFVKAAGKPIEILTKLNEMAGFSADEEIELFEEIKFEPNVMCEHIDSKATFKSSQLEDGDIVCFQKSPQPGSSEQCRYPDVPSFLEYVRNRQVVRFRSLEKPKEDEFCLELSKLHTYDDVVERVAQHLGLDDPSKIRLTSHNCYSQQPKPQPIKYRGLEHLSDMLLHYNQTSDILYYEILDIPLPELQGLKTLKVAFHHATKDEVVIHTVRLPKQSTVGDVINDLKTKVELSHPNAEIRLLEVFYHKIYKIFPLNEKIENINDQYWTLRAEEIPEEEKDFSPPDLLIHVYHFMKDTTYNHVQIQNFGEPFFLVIREHETLAEVKARIQKKLQVPHEEFAKWKFAFMSLGRPEYLQDNDIVASRFQRRDVYGAWEQYLGLEHTDNAPKRSYTANQSIVGISINQIPEKSAPLAIAEKRSDQVTLVAKDIVNAQVGTPVTFLTKSSPQLKEPTLMANNTREGTETAIWPPAHQVVAEADSSSFAKFDAMFAGIQNLLEGKNSEAESSDSFQSPLLSIEEISNAKRTFKQCLRQNLTNVIKLGWTQEFLNSLSVMLTANAIPNNLVEELGWFLSNFDQSCDLYMAAKQDIVEVEEKENSVDDLKQLYHRFMPIRNEAASVDEEIAELERQLTEKKAKKAMLQSSLEDLARQAATSRETVIDAELDMKLNRMRKKQAEKTVVDMERSWESLKAGSSPFLL